MVRGMSGIDDLWRLVCEHEGELLERLTADPPRPGSWLHDSLTSPDPRGPARGVVAWLRSTLEPR